MPVHIPRTSGWYLIVVGLACATAASVTVFVGQKYAAAWKFALHPVLNSIGLGLMALGILEQGNRDTPLVHIGLMATAALCFFLGWLFLFLQKREGGGSHFATGSPWWHKAHVYLGYALLACWLTQVAGGIAKYMKLPEKSTKWHGILAHVMFALKVPQFLIAAIMSLHTTTRYMSEILFMLLFCMLYIAVMIAFFKVGVRVESSTALKAAPAARVSDDAALSPRPERETEREPLLRPGDDGEPGAGARKSRKRSTKQSV